MWPPHACQAANAAPKGVDSLIFPTFLIMSDLAPQAANAAPRAPHDTMSDGRAALQAALRLTARCAAPPTTTPVDLNATIWECGPCMDICGYLSPLSGISEDWEYGYLWIYTVDLIAPSRRGAARQADRPIRPPLPVPPVPRFSTS